MFFTLTGNDPPGTGQGSELAAADLAAAQALKDAHREQLCKFAIDCLFSFVRHA